MHGVLDELDVVLGVEIDVQATRPTVVAGRAARRRGLVITPQVVDVAQRVSKGDDWLKTF